MITKDLKTFSCILPGSIRSKKNSKRIYGFGKFKKVLPSLAYVRWEKQAREWMNQHYFRSAPALITTGLMVCMTAYYKGPKPDLSGCMESVGDCLEGVLWKNDRQIYLWDGSRLVHDLKNPRTIIKIVW